MEQKKVLLAMSGGVDSSASAILLKKQGYEVIGATMKLWKDEECVNNASSCLSNSTITDAKKVCEYLGIPHYVFDFEKEFKKYVVNNFIAQYEQVKTPNPCIECNKYLKFSLLYEKAKELGIEYIATGHYAKTCYIEKYNGYVIKKASSVRKDQSYVLYTIPKELVSKIIFPLGDFTEKSEVRKIVEQEGLTIASKPESQEICFIPDNNHCGFLLRNLKNKPKEGNIVNTKGEILGKHKGIMFHTIGQRKGLGISSKTPLYIIKLDATKNEIILGTEKETYCTELYANELNYLLIDKLTKPIEIKAKVRYSTFETEGILYPIEQNKVKVEFKTPVRAITPGQSVVFYVDDCVLGGGKIM